MQQNVGSVDRFARALLGPTLATLGLVDATRSGLTFGNAASMLGGFFITKSAITRVCPVNAMLGIDTRSHMDRKRGRRVLGSGKAVSPNQSDPRMRSDRDEPSRLFPQMEEHWSRTHQANHGGH